MRNMKNKYIKLAVFACVGAIAGFAYYYFVGCYNHTDDNEVEFKIDRTLLADSSFFYKEQYLQM